MNGDPDWKELRVRIDGSHHQKLVALKILRHKTMTEAIHEALDHYFSDVLPAARIVDDLAEDDDQDQVA